MKDDSEKILLRRFSRFPRCSLPPLLRSSLLPDEIIMVFVGSLAQFGDYRLLWPDDIIMFFVGSLVQFGDYRLLWPDDIIMVFVGSLVQFGIYRLLWPDDIPF